MPTNDRAALLIVDPQNDFCPGGALPVPEGDEVMPVLNDALRVARERGWPVFVSRDWHPPETTHFAANGGRWPVHCVQGTEGADFHPALALSPSATVVTKGTSRSDDGYSAFEGATPEGRPLADALRESGVERLVVGGLATDYCVRASALDALKLGFGVEVMLDAVRGIDAAPGDVERTLEEIRRAGGTIGTSETILA